MINRRRFLQAGAATTLGGALLSTASAMDPFNQAPSGTGPTLPYYVAVFDRRFPESVDFAKAASAYRIETRGIDGDVTDLWYSDLHPRWKKQAVPIAGLTTYGPLFCLERLAWDHGMRVVYQGTHQATSDGNMEHRVSGAVEHAIAEPTWLSGQSPWSADIASLIARVPQPSSRYPLPQAARTPQSCNLTAGATSSQRSPAQQPLYSWVIARPRAV